ncbi:MAG: hypoxanthine phosphoribosyltransferase [Actinomycetota bacterium]|nr:hypoxanthine phosphoribosyltransferase [Actinomycetota bacterium]
MSLAEVRYSAQQIHERVVELGEQVRSDLAGETPLLVAVLKGSVIFVADLARTIGSDLEVDFISVSAYEGGSRETGRVKIVKDLDSPIEDRHVILVEAIVDTGLTLAFLVRSLSARNPKSLRVCALFDKPIRRIAQPDIHYKGFETPEYVVGYGLDFKGRYRNLPYVVGVKDVPALAARPDALNAFFGGLEGGTQSVSPMLR